MRYVPLHRRASQPRKKPQNALFSMHLNAFFARFSTVNFNDWGLWSDCISPMLENKPWAQHLWVCFFFSLFYNKCFNNLWQIAGRYSMDLASIQIQYTYYTCICLSKHTYLYTYYIGFRMAFTAKHADLSKPLAWEVYKVVGALGVYYMTTRLRVCVRDTRQRLSH